MHLANLLTRINPELAKLYIGALFLLADDANPARVYFVAHAAREVINRLPDYLGIEKAKRVDYYEPFKKIAARWRSEFPDAKVSSSDVAQDKPSLSSAPSTDGIGISPELHELVERLVISHESSTDTHATRAKQMIEGRLPIGVAMTDGHIKLAVGRWMALGRAVMKFVHFPTGDEAPPEFSECRRQFEILENHLYSLLADFYDSLEELDGILDEANKRTG